MTDNTIGVDISKAHLDVHRLSDGAVAQFANDQSGLRALIAWLGKGKVSRIIYEPTGPYHRRFEIALEQRFGLVKVNPLQARRFAQARGTRAKTDAIDARMLAEMGAAFRLEPDKPQDGNQRALKELQLARIALVKDQTRLRNRLKTQVLTFTRRQTKLRLSQVARQLGALNGEIETRLSKAPDTARALEILRSITGIGQVAAAAILIECPEIGTLQPKQAASLAGLAPMTRQSGHWRGHAFIQGGRKPLRDALYMPALVAARFNPDLSAKYRSMIKRGKPAKVALICLMRKLIEMANALIKADRKWQPKLA